MAEPLQTLDRYEVIATVTGDRPVVAWLCRREHDDGGAHVAIIATDLDGDQAGLTLGEMAQEALRHEREEHADD